jgi:hypothetical protein
VCWRLLTSALREEPQQRRHLRSPLQPTRRLPICEKKGRSRFIFTKMRCGKECKDHQAARSVRVLRPLFSFRFVKSHTRNSRAMCAREEMPRTHVSVPLMGGSGTTVRTRPRRSHNRCHGMTLDAICWDSTITAAPRRSPCVPDTFCATVDIAYDVDGLFGREIESGMRRAHRLR